jgi:hypothetical protein
VESAPLTGQPTWRERPGKTRYTAEEEQYAEAFAGAMMAQGLGSVAVP